MTQPDQSFPKDAANYFSLADYASMDEDQWKESTRAQVEKRLDRPKAGFGNIGKDFATILNNIVNGLNGWSLGSRSHADSLKALQDQAAATASLSAAITNLNILQSKTTIGGASAFIDFSKRADATSLGTDFDQTYSEDGTSTWGVSGGRATVTEVRDKPRSCVAVYNAKESETDYQLVGASMATAPEFFNSIGQGKNLLLGRMNEAGTSFVYAEFGKFSVELGCVVDGEKTVWDTVSGSIFGGFSFKANTVYWLQCGDTTGSRVFKVLEESTPIITHTEVGTTSLMGDDYRFAGMGVRVYATPFGAESPGRVSAWAFSDNNTPPTVGSGAVMFRASSTDVAISSGTHDLPSNFFDNRGKKTADITDSLTSGSFTVSLSGWYRIKARLKIASGTGFPRHLSLILMVDGDAGPVIGDQGLYSDVEVSEDGGAYDGTSGSSYTPRAISGEVDVYLDANQTVSLATDASSTVGNFEGASGGSQTYFSITMINRSQA